MKVVATLEDPGIKDWMNQVSDYELVNLKRSENAIVSYTASDLQSPFGVTYP